MTFANRTFVALVLGISFAAVGCDVPGRSSAKAPSAESQGEARVIPVSTTTTVSTARASTVRAPAPVSFETAEAAYLEKRYDEAFSMFSAYADGHPGNAWGRYMQGLSAWKAGRLDAAESAFVAALELDPGHEKSLVNLARVYMDQDRAADALVQAKQAVELNPSSAGALRLLGRSYGALGEIDQAVEAYHRALVVDDHDVWSMNNLGLVLIQAGRFDEAVPALARAVELEDGIATFFNNLGIALERSGYPATAAVAFGKALEIDSTYEKATTNLARATSQVVAEVEEDIDLSFLAQMFAADIERWRGTVDQPEVQSPLPVDE